MGNHGCVWHMSLQDFYFKDGCVSKCGTLLSNFFFFFFPEPTLNRLVYSGAALRVDDDDEII